MAVDDNLHGPARTFAAGEVDAVFEVHLVLVGAERPHVLVRRHQHDAMAVGESGGLDRRVKMKADREFVVRGAQLRAAVGGLEYILAIEPGAVGRQQQDTLMHDAEAIGIAVVRRAQHDALRPILARHRHVARPAQHRRAAEHAPECRQFDESGR